MWEFAPARLQKPHSEKTTGPCGKNVLSGQHRRNVSFGIPPDGNESHLFYRLSVDGGN
jgi:hypothetical protein